jgi:hypothetical protein
MSVTERYSSTNKAGEDPGACLGFFILVLGPVASGLLAAVSALLLSKVPIRLFLVGAILFGLAVPITFIAGLVIVIRGLVKGNIMGGLDSKPTPKRSGADNFASLLNSLDAGGAQQLAQELNQSSPAEAAGLGKKIAVASPAEVARMANDLNQAAKAATPESVSSPRPITDAKPIRWCCPGCGRKLRVKRELAGKQAKCPSCNRGLQVPAAGQED